MIDRLKLLPRYLRTFGLFSGLRVFVAAELFERKVLLPGLQFPFILRHGTTDLLVFREIFLFKSYDFEMKDPAVIVDAGANVGFASIFFANRFRKATIYAVEPDPVNFRQLLLNKEHYDRIVPVQAGLWDHDTFIRLKNPNASSWALEVEDTPSGELSGIPGWSVRSLMSKYQIERIDLLKLDIEGSEKEVFEGEVEWLHQTHCILIETHDWLKPGASRAVLKSISEYNFSLQVINGMLLFTNMSFK